MTTFAELGYVGREPQCSLYFDENSPHDDDEEDEKPLDLFLPIA
jgi:hypothetical protein